MVTDEMIVAAAVAGRREAEAWAVRPSPIKGSNVWFLHDANRPRPEPVDPEAVFLEYRCGSRAEAEEHIRGFVWRAGLEAALKVQSDGATKQ